MFRKLLQALLIVLAGSCSYFAPKKAITSDHAHKLPSWAYASMDYCLPSELCFSSEDKSPEGAFKRAQALLVDTLSSSMKWEKEPKNFKRIDYPTKQKVVLKVELFVKKIVENSYQKEMHKNEKLYYSLVAVDSLKIQGQLEYEIDQLQLKIKNLKSNSTKNKNQLVELALERDHLNHSLETLFSIRESLTPTLREFLE